MTEIERIQDLKDRYSALSDNRAVGAILGVANVDLYFYSEILTKNETIAEARMKVMELHDADVKVSQDIDRAEVKADNAEIKAVKKILKNISSGPEKRAITILFKKVFGK